MLSKSLFNLNKLELVYTNSPNENAIYIREQEYGTTIPDAKAYIIGSYGFTSCILVSFYHPERSAMAHLNVFTQIEALSQLWDKYTTGLSSDDSIKVCIIGGLKEEEESVKFASKLCNFFASKTAKVVKDFLYNDNYWSFAINSKTGDILVSNGQRIKNDTKKIFIDDVLIPISTSGDAIFEVVCDGQLINPITKKNVFFKPSENDSTLNNYQSVFSRTLQLPKNGSEDAFSENFEQRLSCIFGGNKNT